MSKIYSDAIRFPFIVKLLGLLCGILFSLFLQGQKNQFDINYGASFPLGKYQQKNFSSQGSGFAKNGIISQLSYSREVKEKLRLMVSYQAMRNPMDNTVLLKEFISQFPTVEYANTNSRAWSIQSIHLGISRDFNLKESKLSLSPSLQIGYSYINRPFLITSNSPDPKNPVFGMSESEVERWALSFALELQTAYAISEKISLLTKMNYFQTEARMDFKRFPAYSGNDPFITERVSYLQKVKILGFSGGLRFHF